MILELIFFGGHIRQGIRLNSIEKWGWGGLWHIYFIWSAKTILYICMTDNDGTPPPSPQGQWFCCNPLQTLYICFIGFSVASWLSSMNYPDTTPLTGVALQDLMERLQLSRYKGDNCNKSAAQYVPNTNGWNSGMQLGSTLIC